MFAGGTARDPRTPVPHSHSLRSLRVTSADSTTLVLAGELDLATTDRLEGLIAACVLRAQLLRIDLRALSFMDCAGMYVLLGAAEICERIGCEFRVIGGPHVHRLASLSGLAPQPWFEGCPSMDGPEGMVYPPPSAPVSDCKRQRRGSAGATSHSLLRITRRPSCRFPD
jgi:anti-anti-sigma factor